MLAREREEREREEGERGGSERERVKAHLHHEERLAQRHAVALLLAVAQAPRDLVGLPRKARDVGRARLKLERLALCRLGRRVAGLLDRLVRVVGEGARAVRREGDLEVALGALDVDAAAVRRLAVLGRRERAVDEATVGLRERERGDDRAVDARRRLEDRGGDLGDRERVGRGLGRREEQEGELGPGVGLREGRPSARAQKLRSFLFDSSRRKEDARRGREGRRRRGTGCGDGARRSAR